MVTELIHNPDRRLGMSGFTLIETMVALTIALSVMTAVFSAVTTSVQSTSNARNTITAFYLAQEAFEYVKNKRDTNGLNGNNWLAGMDSCIGGTPCIPSASLDSSTLTFIDVDAFSTVDERLYLATGDSGIDNVTFYSHLRSDGLFSGFTREIEIEEIETGQEAIVDVTITFVQSRDGTKRFTFREHMFNIR